MAEARPSSATPWAGMGGFGQVGRLRAEGRPRALRTAEATPGGVCLPAHLSGVSLLEALGSTNDAMAVPGMPGGWSGRISQNRTGFSIRCRCPRRLVPSAAQTRIECSSSRDLVFGVWDAFAVSDGHALVVTRRHVASWFDATPDERAALTEGIATAREAMLRTHAPDGFNIGINVGTAAGQTIPHLHVHVIPRYAGDVPDPRGGVRHVIPGRGNYLIASTAPDASGKRLVTGGDDPLLPHIVSELATADRADIVVSFVLESGLDRIFEHLKDLLARGGQLRILTGDYLGISEPDALMRLLDLEGHVGSARVRNGTRISGRRSVPVARSFHPKAYIFSRGAEGTAFVGSSNLSAAALTSAVEWNYRVVSSREGGGFAETVAAFEQLFQASLHEGPVARLDRPVSSPTNRSAADPRGGGSGARSRRGRRSSRTTVQIAALEALGGDARRREPRRPGRPRNRTGKDVALGLRYEPARVQARTVRGASRGDPRPGACHLPTHSPWRHALVTTRADRRRRTPMSCSPRSRRSADANIWSGSRPTPSTTSSSTSSTTRAAASYRKLITYFSPKFLLGLTATPERSDGGDLLALCQQNLVYRCDLVEGVRKRLLSPFHYFGVPDDVDYANIPWRSTRFDEEALTTAVATQRRAENALEQFRKHAATRALGFCVSQRHADFMAAFFNVERPPRGGRPFRRDVCAAGRFARATRARRAGHRLCRGHVQRGRRSADARHRHDAAAHGIEDPLASAVWARPAEGARQGAAHGHRLHRQPSGVPAQAADAVRPSTGDREILNLLERLQNGTQELPPGCEVTYELEAIDILKSLLRRSATQDEALERYYEDFQALHGVRPTAMEVYQDGYNPRSVRERSGSWITVRRIDGRS